MHRISFIFNNFTLDRSWRQGFFSIVAKKVLQHADVRRRIQRLGLVGIKTFAFSVNLIGAARMQMLNKRYRDKDYATDILAFPAPFDVRILKHAKGGIIEKSIGRTFDLGDLFICVPVVKRQARERNYTPQHQMALLMVHGFLHLFGYDHERSKKEEKIMFTLQEQITRSLKVV